MKNGAIEVGDFSRDGLLQMVDYSWNGDGVARVSIREMIGGFNSWAMPKDKVLAKMRRFAKRALPYPENTRHVRLVRTYDFGGCDAATFIVSRIP